MPGDFSDFEGLKSRIIVASGAGSGDGCIDGTLDPGGCGGGLYGYNSSGTHGLGATQTSGGKGKGLYGTFGFGAGNGNLTSYYGDYDGNAGAGGGYFGGGNSENPKICGAGGGSSYISGHKGCISVLKSSKSASEIEFSDAEDPSIHYSGLHFYNTKMIDGTQLMPSPLGDQEIGHRGNGYIRITKFNFVICSICKRNLFDFSNIFVFILINDS